MPAFACGQAGFWRGPGLQGALLWWHVCWLLYSPITSTVREALQNQAALVLFFVDGFLLEKDFEKGLWR